MKRLLNILGWCGLAAWFIIMMGFASGESEEVLCKRIDVLVSDTLNNHFVTRSAVRSMAENSGQHLQGYPISQINTRKLERRIEENDFVLNAEVSKDVTGRLEIRVEPRKALVRIMPGGQQGYYLDTHGKVMPLSDHFTPHIMLASGHIDGPEDGELSKSLREIFEFSSFVAGDPFWDGQIVQLYMDAGGDYEIIPRVGAHQVILGSMDDWGLKLRNLKLLYEQGLNKAGWNTYGKINLKHTNQVICTKR